VSRWLQTEPPVENTEQKHTQPPTHVGSSLADFSTLKMEAICSSETSVHTRSRWRHIQEDGILHSHRCENLKYYLNNLVILRNWFPISILLLSSIRFTVTMVTAVRQGRLQRTGWTCGVFCRWRSAGSKWPSRT
jgi:hypothetical protein